MITAKHFDFFTIFFLKKRPDISLSYLQKTGGGGQFVLSALKPLSNLFVPIFRTILSLSALISRHDIAW